MNKGLCAGTTSSSPINNQSCCAELAQSTPFELDMRFAVNSELINPDDFGKIERVAALMRMYPRTDVLIEGHTDEADSDEANFLLSQRTALNVASVLRDRMMIDSDRITAIGYGKLEPKAPATTDRGRELNRRIVVTVSRQ